jgi:transcriptional regulator with XRE-family HTH domain
MSSVIHYHGTPIWGNCGDVHRIAVTGAGAFVSYARPDQIRQSFEYASKVGIDNGAFSAWKRGLKIDWLEFYRWLMAYYFHEKLEFFVVPDVVEGGEADNDDLIRKLPLMFRDKAAPVWHLHESIDRLVELCSEWPRVCFGSSGQYAVIRTKEWHQRMEEAFEAIYFRNNFETKIHGLRMLDGRVLGNYPLASADSTNLACNVPKTEVKYPELTKQLREIGCDENGVKAGRCAILKGAIESVTPPSRDQWLRGVYGAGSGTPSHPMPPCHPEVRP